MFAVLSPSGKRVIEEHKDDWLLSGAQCGQRENHIMEYGFTKEAQKENTEKQTTTEHLSLLYFLLNLKLQGNLQSSRQRRHYAAQEIYFSLARAAFSAHSDLISVAPIQFESQTVSGGGG